MKMAKAKVRFSLVFTGLLLYSLLMLIHNGTRPNNCLDIQQKINNIRQIKKKNVSSTISASVSVYKSDDPELYCNVHNFATFDLQEPNIECLSTITEPSIMVCIYPVEKDIHISGTIVESGTWERHIWGGIKQGLQRFPKAGFLDFGAHIGK